MWVCLAIGCHGGGGGGESTSSTGDASSSSTTSPEVVCDPMPNGGVGIAFVGEPEAGVWCIDRVCDGGCDCLEVPECNTNGDDAHDVLCDGAEDCADGEVCCATNDGIGVNRSFTTCVMGACAEGASVVCNSDAECNGGFCVRAYSNDNALDMGVCQAGIASACTGLMSADCGGASLAGVDFTDADLRGSSFCSADLGGARLRRAFLDDALLMNANLMGADVGFASFRNANMSYVNLSGATIHKADFTGANLANVVATGALGADVICPDGAMVMIPGDPLCATHQLPP
jgi:hypothetical protein